MKITLILLIRNELDCLKIVLPQLPKPGPDVGYDAWMAIDGRSTDGTVDFLKQHNVPVLVQTERGRGAAFLMAFEKVTSDAYIFFSPDGNEDIKDAPKFRQYLEQGADLVIASRMMKGAHNEEDSQVFRWRKWANKVFNLMANVFFRTGGTYITDSINGYRAITKSAADRLHLDSKDYTIEYQMSMRAMNRGLKIVEFPTYEGSRVGGVTGAPSIPTGIAFLKKFWTELRQKTKSAQTI